MLCRLVIIGPFRRPLSLSTKKMEGDRAYSRSSLPSSIGRSSSNATACSKSEFFKTCSGNMASDFDVRIASAEAGGMCPNRTGCMDMWLMPELWLSCLSDYSCHRAYVVWLKRMQRLVPMKTRQWRVILLVSKRPHGHCISNTRAKSTAWPNRVCGRRFTSCRRFRRTEGHPKPR